MKIFTRKHFIDSVLHPGKLENKCDRAAAWGFTITAGIASAGLLQLFCAIIKKTDCCANTPSSFAQESSSSSVSNAALPVPKAYDISGKKWVYNTHLQHYFTYVAGKYTQVQIREGFLGILKHEDVEEEVLKTDFFHSEAVVFPFYLHVGGNHWTLLYIDMEKRTVEYYDSKKKYGDYESIEGQLQNITQFLSVEDGKPYQFVHKTKKSLQPDSYQCGVWVAYFLSKRLKDPDFDFDAIDITKFKIAKFRNKMMHRIVKTNKTLDTIRAEREEKLGFKAYKNEIQTLGDNGKKDTEMLVNWLRDSRAAKKSHGQEV